MLQLPEELFPHAERLQLELAQEVASHWGSSEWVTAYERRGKDTTVYCALCPLEKAPAALDNASWDIHIGSGGPGLSEFHEPGKPVVVSYHRFSNENGIEPFLIDRDFHGVKPSFWEVTEEFRLYHNLYPMTGTTLVKFDDAGQPHEVVRISPDKIEVRKPELRDYLAARNMVLLLYVDSCIQASPAAPSVRVSHTWKTSELLIRTEADGEPGIFAKDKVACRLLGKRVLRGAPAPKLEEDDGPFPEFIIGANSDGDPVLHSCEHTALANNFGGNPGAPHYLTQVFFRRDVLDKYLRQPSLFEVKDGHIKCASLWLMRIDNNHAKYVIAFLGDLGRDLPAAERPYWRSFNVPPDGTISDVAFRRGFLAEATDATEPSLVFRETYQRFVRDFTRKFGWSLFREPIPEDAHLLRTLHVPLTQEQPDFDDQVLSLNKCMVDFIDDKALASRIKQALPENAKSIKKFELWLSENAPGAVSPESVKFLRELQGLRSVGTGHRKGSDYKKTAAAMGIDVDGHQEAFRKLLQRATTLLRELRAALSIPDDT